MLTKLSEKIKKQKDIFNANLLRISMFYFEKALPIFGFKLKNFYDKSDFPWLQILEDNATQIKEEYLKNSPLHNIMSVQEVNNRLNDFTYDDRWKVVLLKSYETIIKRNAELYPHTMDTINKIPNVTNAIFSVLSPRKNIQLHRGMYRGIVFIHLGVVVPSPVSNHLFIVNGEQKNWKEGEAFGFEDSFQHEVINTSDANRAILLLEVERDDIPFLLKPFHRWIFNKIKQNKNTELIVQNANNQS